MNPAVEASHRAAPLGHRHPSRPDFAPAAVGLIGTALCAHHNTSKGARIPSRLYIWRLERRRRRYFPPNESVKVNWQIGAVPAQPPPPPVVPAVTGRGRGADRIQPRGRR